MPKFYTLSLKDFSCPGKKFTLASVKSNKLNLGENNMTLVQPDLGEIATVLHPVVPKEMLSVRREGRKRVFRINSSSLGIIQECMRKAKYSLAEGWRTENESPATLFGRAVHKALEVFYRGEPEDRVLPKYEHLELMAYGHQPPPTNNDLIYRAVSAFLTEAEPLSSLPAEDKRSLQNGVWILSEYFKACIDDPYIALVDEDGPFIEREFTYRLHEDAQMIIEIFGTIDFAFRDMRTKEIILGDHKTSSALSFAGSSYFDRDKPNHQYTMYMLGARRVFNLPVENFMVNVIEVKAKPKTAKAKGVSFPRQITKRTEEDFEELKEVLLDAVCRWRISSETGVWPMGSVNSCNQYGGCTYKEVCASPKSIRENLLKNKFNKRSDNVVK